jgi:serine-type D-Ala-D-Ala carboxypeptidase/endopeptidase
VSEVRTVGGTCAAAHPADAGDEPASIASAFLSLWRSGFAPDPETLGGIILSLIQTMRIARCFYFLLLTTTLLNACASPPAAVALQDRFPSDVYIQALLEDIVPGPRTGGVIVGVVEPDGSRRVIAYGDSRSNGGPLGAESVLEIGSLTKVFTGVLLADMVRRGQVELTEPVARLLPPGVRVPSRGGKEITLLDLATHTSGLPVMPGNFPEGNAAKAYAEYTVEQMYDFLSSYELPRDPGEAQEYSNFLSLLGHALALRAGKPYEAMLRERVLSPLGMEHTAITLMPEMERRLTRGHTGLGNSAPYFVAPAFAPSGGLKSTINDMLNFASANLVQDGTPIHAALRDARQPHRPIDDAGEYWGLAWGVGEQGNMVGHSGGTFGYGSYINIDLKARRAIVVLTNFAGRDATLLGVHLLDPSENPRPKPPVARAVAAAYRDGGLEKAISRFRDLHATAPDRWNFDEAQLNSVGYWLLGRGAVDDAIAIFRLNVEMHPEAPNPRDSLGDAYMAAGRLAEAVGSFRSAVALAEAADHPALSHYRANLEKAIRELGS